jgi:hypothetical protein
MAYDKNDLIFTFSVSGEWASEYLMVVSRGSFILFLEMFMRTDST